MYVSLRVVIGLYKDCMPTCMKFLLICGMKGKYCLYCYSHQENCNKIPKYNRIPVLIMIGFHV